MKDLTDKEFFMIRDYIKKNFGISLADEKKSLVYSRLRATLQEKGFNDFTEYFNYLIKDKSGEAIVRFIDKVTTNHTFFMREVDHFDFFRDTVLPYLETACASKRDIRLWCAACSSGEEPYTLQMIMQDYFKDKPEKWDTQILATDISSNVLTKATRGAYAAENIKSLPDKWRRDYFTQNEANQWTITESVRKKVVYRKLNLMDDRFPFKKPMQVIFCRNVMIYFDAATRDALVEKFYEWTEPDGYLFIGHSESLSQTGTKYKYVQPAVYRK